MLTPGQVANHLATRSCEMVIHQARRCHRRHAIVHLLAMRPLSTEDVAAKIRLPAHELKPVVSTLARQDAGKWQLSDKVYKDLDVWRFKYPSEDDRKAAIDHAVRAYDRLRLSKDDKLWQLLLPKAERGKGKVLSRLHLGQSTMPRHTSPMSDNASSAVGSPCRCVAGHNN